MSPQCHSREGTLQVDVPAVSQQEGDDGRAQGGIIPEFPEVAAVLPLSPDRHLHEAHQREQRHCGDSAVTAGTRHSGDRGAFGHSGMAPGTWRGQETLEGYRGHGGTGDMKGPQQRTGDMGRRDMGTPEWDRGPQGGTGDMGRGKYGAEVGALGMGGDMEGTQGSQGGTGDTEPGSQGASPPPAPPLSLVSPPLTRQTLGHDGETDPGPDLEGNTRRGGVSPIGGVTHCRCHPWGVLSPTKSSSPHVPSPAVLHHSDPPQHSSVPSPAPPRMSPPSTSPPMPSQEVSPCFRCPQGRVPPMAVSPPQCPQSHVSPGPCSPGVPAVSPPRRCSWGRTRAGRAT